MSIQPRRAKKRKQPPQCEYDDWTVRFGLHDGTIEDDWQKEQGSDDLPPASILSGIDFAAFQGEVRQSIADTLLDEREEADQALANGKRSPDGRFVVGTVDFGGLGYSAELVVGDTGKPEQRYRPPFQWLGEYRWLNQRTIVLRGDDASMESDDFYALDAATGAMNLVARALVSSDSDRVVDFGVSGPDTFWYTTGGGQKHEVTVPNGTLLPFRQP